MSEANKVIGWVTYDNTTGAWWIMADGSKLSAGSCQRNHILMFLQHQQARAESASFLLCFRYMLRAWYNVYLRAIYVYFSSKKGR